MMGHFENRLRVVLAEERITIQELADAVGLHRNTIANLRDGTPTVRWDTLAAVATYLKRPPWELFPWIEGDEDDRPAK